MFLFLFHLRFSDCLWFYSKESNPSETSFTKFFYEFKQFFFLVKNNKKERSNKGREKRRHSFFKNILEEPKFNCFKLWDSSKQINAY